VETIKDLHSFQQHHSSYGGCNLSLVNPFDPLLQKAVLIKCLFTATVKHFTQSYLR